MNRRTRFAVRLVALAVVIVGAVILLPGLLGGLEFLLRELRLNWWLYVLVALAIAVLVALRKRR